MSYAQVIGLNLQHAEDAMIVCKFENIMNLDKPNFDRNANLRNVLFWHTNKNIS